ncbi:FtsW/RodA/SpoVE family cell cycle protein [Paenibacillus planticolens]|uniref:Cell division protein FtsW (Lipid II flippase) n=1 Tax=Paenibacillus planticolens TaxID=2654976 RepID=A0ABX1ZLM4_9BACL|nr:FtsW/RodA/SpoVE family cell cycle protein [Paenibacillus planticolens]NOV00731.1 hypothetical protein [Paenibacillus planticolens]
MNAIRHHEEIRFFLNEVCTYIKAREVHKEVKMELENHLEDLIQEKLDCGTDIDDAIRESISQMGSPEIIGLQFHKVHRPHFDWKLFSLLSVFVVLGLFAVYAAQASLTARVGFASIGVRQIVYVCIGMVLMLILSFTDYRKWAKYSWMLYIGTIVIMLYSLNTGSTVNGAKGHIQIYGTIGVNIVSLSPYLLLIALAGIWSQQRETLKTETLIQKYTRVICKNIATVWLPSVLLLAAPSITDFVLFFIGSLVMLLVLKKHRVILLSHFFIFPISLFIFILSQLSYRMGRLKAFFLPDNQLNYMIIQSKKAIVSAGWWGQGFGTPLKSLPNLHDEMMFSFLIYCFGWAVGIFIFMAVILFIFRALSICTNVKEQYGKALVSSLLALFSIQFMWNMMMTLGWAPLGSFTLPFISYNGALVIIHFAAIGVILNVYRQKDLIFVR